MKEALGITLIASLVVLAIVTPLFGYDVIADVSPSRILEPPSSASWLGTDQYGRDIAWRLALATRAFVGPAALAAGIAIPAAIFLGGLAGWFGGAIGAVLRFPSTVLSSIPQFVLILLVLSIYGSTPWVLGCAAGVAFIPSMAEAIHERIESFRADDFLLAHRAHGISEWRLALVHVLWHGCGPLVSRHLLSLVAGVLVLETTLSYLGFGVPEPYPSWGNMIAQELDHSSPAWWPLFAPAVAIFGTLATLNALRSSFAEDDDV
jgi:peptide/nickel transport system permease protein